MTAPERHALLFPGHGSQRAGMGQEIYENSPAAREIFTRAVPILGYDLREICFVDPRNQLTGEGADTSIIQPALLTVSVATAAALTENWMPPATLHLGHSVGKYGALVAGGSLDFEPALRFISERGRLMKESKELGTVVAVVIGLGGEIIQKKLADVGEKVGSFKLTVENSTSVSMVGGLAHQWTDASQTLKEAGAKIVRLYNEAPLSHHPILTDVQRRLNELKLKFKDPNIPTLDDISNRILDKAEEVEGSIIDHLIRPISWKANIKRLESLGIKGAIEVGPGEVLQGLLRRDHPEMEVFGTDTWKKLQLAVQRFGPPNIAIAF